MPTITIINATSEAVRIAVYARSTRRPTLGTIAWRIVEPPPNNGQTIMQIPEAFAVFANYSFDPATREDPGAGNRTNVVQFGEATARFVVGTVQSQDRHATAATITQLFDGLVINEARIENRFTCGVWAHITKGGNDVYAPQVISPGAVLMADLRATFYLAVISQFVSQGGRLIEEETSLTETAVLAGGAVTVRGSRWQGYTIT